ncbi:MAG: rhomboid family intramembrane serine protease [Acidobacteria bacterium]|nr:rhomboid family intramembrane serine protease [Acidobacteriota bacterium]
MNSPFHSPPHGRPRISFGTGPLTPGIKGIIFTCAGVFVLQALVPGNWLESYLGLSSRGLLGRYFLWQPVTYLFLHSTGNLFHLVFNMLMLWMFGGELERRWGTQSFLQYYFLCGVGAGLISVAADVLAGLLRSGEGAILSPIPTIGASGAVYGLLAAQAILFPNRILLVFLIFPMRMRVAVFLMAAITLWVAIGSANSSAGTAINHVAHLGGMALGWVYLHKAWNPMRLWRDWRWQQKRKRYHVVSDIKDDDHDRYH